MSSRNQQMYANVAWVIVKWMKRKCMGTHRESMIVRGQFVMKLAKKMQLLTNGVLDSLKASILCRSLDSTTLKELIDPDGRLIAEDPAPSLLRFFMPKPPRPTLQDLSDRMCCMGIQLGVLVRM
uniref:Uncharacterized protein n=1 Tax=Tanacetum cinerariifolium TaxID=118510 RepID=A0A699T9F3_TANCI|nr:hypothetical protein [Tanacetum cinerariifolium]